MDVTKNMNEEKDLGVLNDAEKEEVADMEVDDSVDDIVEICMSLKAVTKRLAEMSNRVDILGDKVESQDRVSSLIRELRELPRLFSGADALSIDEEGWQSINEGGTVIGAYVRSEHRKRLAAEANKAGEAASSGSVSGGTGAVYSVDEIRSMDRSTVRQNLDKVLSSLEAAKD